MNLDLSMEHYTLNDFHYYDENNILHWFNIYPNTHKVIEEWVHGLTFDETFDEGYEEIKPNEEGFYEIPIRKTDKQWVIYKFSFSQLLRLSDFMERKD